MENKNIWFVAGIGAIILLIYYSRKKNPVAQVEEEEKENPFYSPWFQSSPGIYPQYPGFQSQIDVYINNPLSASLAYQYMPVFGLIGVSAWSS